jgi:citrate lyase beta subunit
MLRPCAAAGKMIDNPTVLQARNVLALAERLEHVN